MAKNAVDKRINSIRIKGILQQFFGWLNAVLFGIILLFCFATIRQPSDVGLSIFCSVLTAGAILLIVLGVKNINLIKTFQNYSARLTTDPAKSIDSLAASMGIAVEIVKKNISSMLKHGLFPDAFIDKQTNRLVFTNLQQPLQTPLEQTLQQPLQAPLQQAVSDTASIPVTYAIVQCRGCGATNKIVLGSVEECDFCGSPISM